ncbi:tumor protein p53-inducible protein 13 [Vipera latastei]
MGEPRPPPGAPVLLFLLSLASGGGGQVRRGRRRRIGGGGGPLPPPSTERGGAPPPPGFASVQGGAWRLCEAGPAGLRQSFGASPPSSPLAACKANSPSLCALDQSAAAQVAVAVSPNLPSRSQVGSATCCQRRCQPLAWIPRGTTLHAPKVEVAFAAPGLETRLHHRWLQRGMGRGACPAQQKLLPLWDRLPVVQQFRTYGRLRRAVFLPRFAPTGTKRLAEKGGRVQEEESLLSLARPTFQEEKDSLKPARRTLPNQPGDASEVPGHRSGAQTPPPSVATEAGAAHEAGCRCPDSRRATSAARALEAGQGVLRVPTPRTEEAAWAASALTFLLVLLTLAVLYTRLHRKCRRGTSLYWMTSGEEGRETVAAVLKRRIFSHHRRAKRSRQPLQQPQRLLPGSSSEDDSSSA